MAHLIRPNMAPQRPVMMSEHVALGQACQSLANQLRQTECKLNALMNHLSVVVTANEIKDDTGAVRAIEFSVVPRIAAPPVEGASHHADADASAN